MTLDEFLKQVYHTRLYVIIPALNRTKIDKRQFLNKKGLLDSDKLDKYLVSIYEQKFKKKII